MNDILRFDIMRGPGRQPSTLRVLWRAPLDQRDIAADFRDDLRLLPGVEWVEVYRYSAYIKIATHITNLSTVEEDVINEIRNRWGDAKIYPFASTGILA